MFAHLHTHTEYSELDGLAKIEPLVERARSMGQQALAITDHGNLYGAIDFYQAARKADIRPLLGMEAYVAPGSRTERGEPRSASTAYHHLVLLAQNGEGWRNLIQLATKAHLEGFYYKPRVDRELLAEHSAGLIALSGCPSGELHKALEADDKQQAHRIAAWYRETFDDRYYLEIQRHQQLQRFEPVLKQTVQLARETGIPLVATQDAHYCDPGDHDAHDLLLCIGTNATRDEEKRFRFEGQDFYLTDEQYMLGEDMFADLPEAVTNTQLVAERCDVTLEFDRLQLPETDLREGETADERLAELAFTGLDQRHPNAPPSYRERLEYELSVVRETGFAEYFLIVMDFSQFAAREGIAKTVRGSAAGSLILFCLGITDIDPLEYKLVFERFLNPERREMPDIDMDFADNRRDEVIRYVAEKYGRDRVAQIITFGTLGAKAAIRDTGRALGMGLSDVDRIARLIPNQLNITLKEAVAQTTELRDAGRSDPDVQELLKQAQRLNGVVRHASTHAAAVVISRDPLSENVPLRRPVNESDESESIPMTQWAMDQCAAVGLLKMDFLGLTNLTILNAAVELVRKHEGVEIDPLTLPDGDAKAYDMLARGETFGVFQLESGGMRRTVADLKPESVNDLAALLALYRPGPMEHIPRFIDSKHGRERVTYPHRDLAETLDDTYGVIVYQDQVLHIARKFAGYTLGEADVMRKAMGKKVPEIMQAERGKFLSGAQALGYSQRDAETIFDLIEPFAGYAFNKAHAVCYAAIAYQTAWFKANYPAPYMAAVLRAAAGNSDRVREAAAECARLKIKLLPPNINLSGVTFDLERFADGRPAIRFGLATVKNVGRAAVEPLIAEREAKGRIVDIDDLCQRIDAKSLNRRALESLAKAGTFDDLMPRGAMVASAADVLRRARRAQELRDSGQTSMFDLFGNEVATPTPLIEEHDEESIDVTPTEQLHWERELLGAYVSQHPLQAAAQALQPHVTNSLSELQEDLIGQTVSVAGLVNNVRQLTTRKGDQFCAVEIEDLSGVQELTVWPEQWRATKAIWTTNQIVLAKVSVKSRGGDRLTLSVEHVEAWTDSRTSAEPGPLGDATPPAAVPVRPARPPQTEPPRAVRPTVAPMPAPTAPPPVGAAAAIWVTLRDPGDRAVGQDLLQRMGDLIQAMPGDDAVFLRIEERSGPTLLELPKPWQTAANYAMVAALKGLLREHGDAELGPPPAAAASAAAGG